MSDTEAVETQHLATHDYAEGRFAFRCSCGVAFVVRFHAYVVASVERVAKGDPRECPRALPALEGAARGVDRFELRYALLAVAEWRRPAADVHEPAKAPARVASDARVARAVRKALRAERDPNARSAQPKGGGRVSRPPESATHELSPASLLGPQLVSDRLIATTQSAKDARVSTSSGAGGDASRTPAGDRSAPCDEIALLGHEGAAAACRTQLLANGTDTLRVTWDPTLDPREVERLTAHKKVVQEMPGDGCEARITFGGESWQMSPSGGRRIQFVLNHERADLEITTKGKKKGEDAIRALAFNIRSETLWEWGVEKTWAWMKKIACAVHAPEGGSEDSSEPEAKLEPTPELSRVDLCGDFLDLPVESADLREFVCRPRRKAIYKRLPSGKARMIGDRADPDDLGCAEFWSGLGKTGHQFGKGQLMCRIYDKTLEVRELSRKFWLYDQWKRCAACGAKACEHEAVANPRAAATSTAPLDGGRAGCERTGCLAFVLDESGFTETRDCAECAGSGKGSTRVACRTCRGGKRARLTCGMCHGEGKVDAPRLCFRCKGKKTTADQVWRVEIQVRRTALKEFCKGVERSCQRCAGLGERKVVKPCRQCRGARDLECLSCHGSGEKRFRGRFASCERCSGSGSVACKKCGGAGWREVSRPCKSCSAAEGKEGEVGMGWKLEKPKPSELVDPRVGLVVRDASRGARNVGEDLTMPLDSLEGFLALRGALWRYVVGGGRGVRPWLAWRVPGANPQRTRWQLRPEWAVVQAAPKWTESTQQDELVRVKKKRAKFKKLMEGFAGYASAMISCRRDEDDEELRDFDAAFGLLYTETSAFLAEREERRPEAGWTAVVREKQELAGRWGLLGEKEMERLRPVPEMAAG